MAKRFLPIFSIVLFVSSAALCQLPAASPSSTNKESIADALANKNYYYSDHGNFRIQLPSKIDGYKPNGDEITWKTTEASISISHVEVEYKTWTGATPDRKLAVLSTPCDIGWTKAYEKVMTVSGLQAKETKCTHHGNEKLIRRLWVDRTVFTLAAVVHAVDDAEEIVKQAFDTFEPVSK